MQDDLGLAGRKPWMPGDTVGRYTLVAKIAIGGMAEIWLARQAGMKGFEKVVVIKKIGDSFSEDPEFVEMFLDEARIAAQLNHPNIVQIYDLGEKDGAYYIAMEYLPGEHLAAVARAGNKIGRPLPMAYGVKLIAAAADGLGYAHARTGMDGKPLNIVHRDISPQNLIVTYDGALKVVDFGIAKAANRVSRTSDGKFKGKAAYMSPEQARGEPLDGRSDVFALGVVLFEAVTHTRLFQFDDPIAAFAAIAGDNASYPTARERNPEVPAALDFIISRALARDRSERFQSAKELQAALEEWLRRRDDAPTTADIAEYMASVFEERIRQRDRLLEAASTGDVSRASMPASTSLGEDTERSMPGASAVIAKVRRPHLVVAGVAALALIAGVAVLWPRPSAGRNEPTAQAGSRQAPLEVDTQPSRATIVIDGTPRGAAPLTLNDLGSGDHTLEASLDGYNHTVQVVKLTPGERQKLVLTLTPLAPPSREPEDGGTSLALDIGTPPPNGTGSANPEQPKEEVKQPSRGALSLDTQPWTNVYLGSRKLGETPLVRVSLPAGHHTLQLVNEEEGIKKRIEVDIEGGKTTTVKKKL